MIIFEWRLFFRCHHTSLSNISTTTVLKFWFCFKAISYFWVFKVWDLYVDLYEKLHVASLHVDSLHVDSLHLASLQLQKLAVQFSFLTPDQSNFSLILKWIWLIFLQISVSFSMELGRFSLFFSLCSKNHLTANCEANNKRKKLKNIICGISNKILNPGKSSDRTTEIWEFFSLSLFYMQVMEVKVVISIIQAVWYF